jgi:hypothetical protein
MEKGGTRLFRRVSTVITIDTRRNIVELESHRLLREKINELIDLSDNVATTTSEMTRYVHDAAARFGPRFTIHLIRSLQHEDPARRESVTWLLILLDDREAIPHLQSMARNEQCTRSLRLSAALTLAGMGATEEITKSRRKERHYAISSSCCI